MARSEGFEPPTLRFEVWRDSATRICPTRQGPQFTKKSISHNVAAALPPPRIRVIVVANW
jgi:hypothetical protein